MLIKPVLHWPRKGIRSERHESELSLAPSILNMLPLYGNIITGDALYCQRNLCEQIVQSGGDYLVIVKKNQPRLHGDIAFGFENPPAGENLSYAEQHSKHGDRIEARRLWATDALREYLCWPGLNQVCKIEREVESKGVVSKDVRYAITSLAVGPEVLLKYVRGHWGIENRNHWVRDVTMGEDASQVRTHSAPQVMAALRNVVINILRLNGVTNIAAALRQNAWQQGAALRFLGLYP